MIGRIHAIALNTFREAIRNKVLYGILVGLVGANVLALVCGQMSLNEEARFARDIGLAATSVFGAFTAIYLGVVLLYGEIQKKTVHTILAKPIQRWEFVIGKYLGMAVTLTILAGLFMLALFGMLRLQGTPFGGAMAKAALLVYMEILLVAAIAIFFSSFSSPFLSGIFTLALFVMGRVGPEIRDWVARYKDDVIRTLGYGLEAVPKLYLFGVSGGEVSGKHVSVHGDFVSWGYVGTAGLYALAWIAGLLVLSAIIFERRDFV